MGVTPFASSKCETGSEPGSSASWDLQTWSLVAVTGLAGLKLSQFALTVADRHERYLCRMAVHALIVALEHDVVRPLVGVG